MIQAVQGLSRTMASVATAAQMSFPNVSLVDFDAHSAGILNVSRALQMSFAPLVRDRSPGRPLSPATLPLPAIMLGSLARFTLPLGTPMETQS
jgi:hypothetical protein